jgi:hypothetical protein
MRARKRRKNLSLPMMMTDLMLASWETIARRTLLMAQHKCSPAEYRRMVREKTQAAAASGLRLISSGGRGVDGFGPGALARPSSRQRQAPAKEVEITSKAGLAGEALSRWRE